MTERFKLIPEVCFVYIKDNKILLGRRANTGWQDGMYCFPAGHGEEGESMAEACAREAFEEVALISKPKDLKLIHVQHRWSGDAGGHARVGFYFVPMVDAGEPVNKEPDKCDDLGFFPLDSLPPMVEPFKAALEAILRGEAYSEFGWEDRN